MGEGSRKRRKHEVAYPQKRKASHCRSCHDWTKHKQEDLNNIMVTLKVAEGRVPTKNLRDQIRQLVFPAVELFFCLVLRRLASPVLLTCTRCMDTWGIIDK